MLQPATFDKIKTLIAEDDKSVLLVYNVGLKEEVFEKRFITNGDDVLNVCEEWRPDILLLDIMLPGTSGYAVLKAIRENGHCPDTAIIMATSLSGRDAVKGCLELGIQGYLVKPFSHQEVSQKVLGYYQKANPEKAATALAIIDVNRVDVKVDASDESSHVKDWLKPSRQS